MPGEDPYLNGLPRFGESAAVSAGVLVGEERPEDKAEPVAVARPRRELVRLLGERQDGGEVVTREGAATEVGEVRVGLAERRQRRLERPLDGRLPKFGVSAGVGRVDPELGGGVRRFLAVRAGREPRAHVTELRREL